MQDQIQIMQGLILTYQQYGCNPEVLAYAQERLTQLIAEAK